MNKPSYYGNQTKENGAKKIHGHESFLRLFRGTLFMELRIDWCVFQPVITMICFYLIFSRFKIIFKKCFFTAHALANHM